MFSCCCGKCPCCSRTRRRPRRGPRAPATKSRPAARRRRGTRRSRPAIGKVSSEPSACVRLRDAAPEYRSFRRWPCWLCPLWSSICRRSCSPLAASQPMLRADPGPRQRSSIRSHNAGHTLSTSLPSTLFVEFAVSGDGGFRSRRQRLCRDMPERFRTVARYPNIIPVSAANNKAARGREARANACAGGRHGTRPAIG